jgi:periplasmic divalent cation tolerance protein
MTDYLQIMTTIDSKDAAQAIAQALVEQHLAGCVQVIGPITSSYRWEGRIETDEEWLCLIKTAAGRYSEVEAVIRGLHSYDEPEILAVPVATGSAGYLQWLGEQVGIPEPS